MFHDILISKVAVTNYCKYGISKQQKFIHLQFWRPRNLNSRCQKSHAPSDISRKKNSSLLLLASGGTQKSLAVLTFICITFISVLFSHDHRICLCVLSLFLLSIHPYYYKIAYKKFSFFSISSIFPPPLTEYS